MKRKPHKRTEELRAAADRLVSAWYQYALLARPSIRDAVRVDVAASHLRALLDDGAP